MCYESNYSVPLFGYGIITLLFHSTLELNPMVNPVDHVFLHIYSWKTMAAIVALLAIVCGALLFYLT